MFEKEYPALGEECMSKRVTFVLDDNLVKKLKIIQANNISKSKTSVSFSSVINDALRKGLK